MPILTGLNPNVALFTAGIGTLAFQLITYFGGKTVPPIFLASSFAFIAPISIGVYVALSALIRVFGKGFIEKLLPAVVVGPVIMSIGLILSPVAVSMALGKAGDAQVVPLNTAMIISFITLASVLLASILGKGLLSLIPILVGIVVGYITSLFFGIIDFSSITAASWVSMPKFVTPELNWQAILFILPIAIAPAVEHIGDMLAISNVTGKDYLKKPGLHNTLLGDGVATMLASAVGGPPNTTYSEVTGAVTITKAFNPAIMTWAALFAIALAFVGKVGAVLSTIPIPVMGGIMLLLFGVITAVGIKTLATEKVDFDCPRNLAIIAIILVFAIGGMSFKFGGVAFSGIGLGAITGIILNLILPQNRTDESK